MIPNTKDRELATSGVVATGTFGISLPDAAHLMTILRSTLYSDKVLAVLREYSANAWDAHKEVGKADLPISVKIPTSMQPVLTIRDFGPGLSPDDVFSVYTQYGASTKRKSNASVGMLGIGSKSAFAYSDSFTVTSWYDNKKRIYGAVLDPSRIGIINLLHEEDCSPEETGIEIQIAVRPNDVLEFHNKARQLFQYFNPQPDINIDLPVPPVSTTQLKHGMLIDDNEREWVALMGCIPYKIDLEQVKAVNNNGTGIAEYITNISGILYFDIGDVHISASREGLEYSDTTKKALISKFALLVDEFVENTLDNIDKGGFTWWEKRVKAQVLASLHLPIPKNCKEVVKDHVKLKHQPKTGILTQAGQTVSGINISSTARLVLKDDDRNLTGFHLSYGDYLFTKDDKHTWDQVKDDLAAVLKASSLEGMPIVHLSSLVWYAPPKKWSRNKFNKKHLVSSFKLAKHDSFWSPYSSAWETVDRVPTNDDVFVIVNKFKGHGFDFFSMYRQDKTLADFFGVEMPVIYGYKTTDKKPVKPEDCTGTEYRVWRETFLKSLFTPKVAKLYNYWEWSKAADNYYGDGPNKKSYEEIRSSLGVSHPITRLFKMQQRGKRITKKLKRQLKDIFERFSSSVFQDQTPAYKLELRTIFEAYPLISLNGDLTILWGSHAKVWLEYIKLVDRDRA